jgi:eukaryotic-like serine/threonine-protein kinase
MDCPKCGQQWPDLSGGALKGGCPSCLLEFAFGPAPTPVSSDDAAAAPLRRLGPYTLLDTLGSGGMGVVYLARHESLDRTVALKVLNPACARQKGFPERFQREGQVLAALDHPNIVGVHDLGCDAGTYYLVMERVVGRTLRGLLEDGRLPAQRAIPLFSQLCDGLQYAHDHGVVHRDIKPENVLVEEGGRVKIGDFGVAKLLGDTAVLAPLTESGAVVGTRCYIAPEQLERGKNVDHRADLYALGVVLYEMLTGELPLGVFPPPSHTAGVDPRFDALILRTLDKDPARRPGSARELKAQVLALANPPRRKRRWPAWLAASSAVLALAAGIGIVHPWNSGGAVATSPASTGKIAAEPAGRRVLTGHKGRVWAVAFDSDSRYLATAAEDRQVRLWHTADGTPGGAFDAFPRGELGYLALAFAPGGRQLATAGGDGNVRIWDIAQRKERLVVPAHSREATSLAYAPDGAVLASASHDRTVKTWDTRTGKLLRTFGGFSDPVLAVAYSPEGKRLAAGAMNGSVQVWDAETGAELAKLGHARRVLAVAFAPDNRLLATASHDRTVKLWDLTTLSPVPRILADGPEVWAVAFSPDSSVLAAGSHDGVVRLWDPATGKLLERLTGHTAPLVSLAFSADGRFLASGSWDQTAILWNR